MKIISGFFKGRKINSYNIDGTRPTMDRVKESLFGMIQNHLKNSVCLDLFAGSGSLGLEAISNGSKYCYFVDLNKKCTDALKEVIKQFKIEDKVSIINKDYMDFLNSIDVKFDLVFLDPPYKMHCLNEVISFLLDNNLLNNDALIICEVDELYLNDFNKLERIKMRKYGDKFIIIFKNILL